MKNKRNILLAVIFLLLASLACQSLAPSGAEPVSDSPEAVATEEESSPILPFDSSDTEEESAQTGGLYDGSWTGTNTVDDKEILFTVENNEIASVSLNYTGESNGCDYHGATSVGTGTSSLDDSAINGDTFYLFVKSVNDELTFTGAFTSESEASGTLLIKSSADGLCGAYEKEVSWIASKGSAFEAEETEDTGGVEIQGDPVVILTQFFNAVNAGDIDSAIAVVDENILFSIGTTVTKFNSTELESYLVSTGATYELIDAESMAGGTMVQFKIEASDGTTYSYCQAFVLDGKISMMSWMP